MTEYRLEQPTPCPRCGDVAELNDMFSFPGGELICPGCCDREDEDPDEREEVTR